MTIEYIALKILNTFTTAKKCKGEDEDIRYQIDDKTTLYLLNQSNTNQSNTRFKMGIILGIKSHPYLTGDFIDKDFYVDFQFQNESLVIDDKLPWGYSSKSSGKVNLNSLEEIVLFLKKEWEDYNNFPKNK